MANQSNFSTRDLGYILLLTIIFLSNVISAMSFKIGYVLIIGAVAICAINRIRDKAFYKGEKNEVISVFFKWNFTNKAIIHIYTITLVILNLTERRYLSSNIMTYLNAVSAITFVILIGEHAWNVSVAALIFAWIVGLICSILNHGIRFATYMEFHDLGFAAGYVFIYYLISSEKWKRIDVLYIFFSILIILVTNKRIAIGGLLLIMLLHTIFRLLKSERTKKRLISFFSLAMLIGLYVFVYLVINNIFFDMISKWIDSLSDFFMGRNYYWKTMAKLCEFKLSFLGFGRNASDTLFAQDYSYLKVRNVHSDILKMYMECGFLLFGIWLCNYLLGFTKAIGKHFGFKSMYIFFIMTLYTFFVYITDNTETYLITQYFYMLAPMISCLHEKMKETPRNGRKDERIGKYHCSCL